MRGRAQPVFTKVLSPEGFRPIGDLLVGDLVIGSNGQPTPVLGVFPQGEKDIYRVAAQDGALDAVAVVITSGRSGRPRTGVVASLGASLRPRR